MKTIKCFLCCYKFASLDLFSSTPTLVLGVHLLSIFSIFSIFSLSLSLSLSLFLSLLLRVLSGRGRVQALAHTTPSPSHLELDVHRRRRRRRRRRRSHGSLVWVPSTQLLRVLPCPGPKHIIFLVLPVDRTNDVASISEAAGAAVKGGAGCLRVPGRPEGAAVWPPRARRCACACQRRVLCSTLGEQRPPCHLRDLLLCFVCSFVFVSRFFCLFFIYLFYSFIIRLLPLVAGCQRARKGQLLFRSALPCAAGCSAAGCVKGAMANAADPALPAELEPEPMSLFNEVPGRSMTGSSLQLSQSSASRLQHFKVGCGGANTCSVLSLLPLPLLSVSLSSFLFFCLFFQHACFFI